jgi:hypothetical protein
MIRSTPPMPLTMVRAALLSQCADLESDIHTLRRGSGPIIGQHPYMSLFEHVKCIRALADEIEKHCGETVDSGILSHDRDTKCAD